MKRFVLALAVLLGALGISPALFAAVEAARSVDVVLLNQTAKGMTLVGSGLSHGCWHKTPPARIEANQYLTWSAESCGILTGTEGWARYQLDGVSGTAYFYWDNPFIGSNSFHDSAPAGYETGHVGGKSNRTTIFYFIRAFSDGPMNCNAQWVVDQLSTAPQDSLSTFDRLLGIITNPFKEQGISGWVQTGCTATAMVVPVRDAQHSTDGFWTIDTRLISFNVGGFTAPPNRYIRIEVRPGTQAHDRVDAHHVTPVDILLLSAPVLIDTDGPFLEFHPDQGFQIWDNNSQFVGEANVPTTMTTGQVIPVSVTMQNNGTSTWTAANSYRLGSQSPQDNSTWGFGRVMLDPSDSIVPGQSKTFTFNITAPSTPGTYSFQWRMLQENVQWFGAATPTTHITVTAPPVITSISGQGDRLVGSTITNTVTVSGGVPPYSYRFLFFYGGFWHEGQPYSASNSWTWTPSSTGSYATQVWVKSAGSTAAWDAYSQYSFNVTPTAPLVINSFTASATSVTVGALIAVTLNAGGSIAPLQWAPFRSLNGSGIWIPSPSPPYTNVAYLGNGSTWYWRPTAADVGTWTLAAWVRGSAPSRWGSWGNGEVGTGGPGQAPNLTVTVTAPPPPLIINSFTANATSVHVGTPIAVTLNASGSTPPLQWAPFRSLVGSGVWIPAPGPPYTNVVYQGNGTTWYWTPTAADVGTWTIAAWARGSLPSMWGAWGNGEVGTNGAGQAPNLTVTVTPVPVPDVHVIWMQPGYMAGFGGAGNLVLAGRVTNVPAGTLVNVIYDQWSVGIWMSAPNTTTDSNGIWYTVIPNANFSDNYSVIAVSSGIQSPGCWSGPDSNRLIWCP